MCPYLALAPVVAFAQESLLAGAVLAWLSFQSLGGSQGWPCILPSLWIQEELLIFQSVQLFLVGTEQQLPNSLHVELGPGRP